MKTITEFAGSTLKNALKTKQELTTTGKTAEELPAAMGEALKLEGDKLNLLLSALEVVEKKINDLKRVVVWSLQEGEKQPRGTEQKGEHYFGIEYFPPMPGQEPKKHGRGKGRDGKGRDDRRGGKRRGRGPRSGEGQSAEGGEKSRRPRRARGPRPEGAAQTPAQPLKPIQPKPQSSPQNSGDSTPTAGN